MRSNEMKEAELLRRYFLGELEAEASEDLERRLLAEGELFDLAEAMEGDLLAACTRGELSPAERETILRRLAASPAGQARLALVQDLVALAAKEERPPAVVLPFRRFDRPIQLERPAARVAALAASLTLVLGGLWLAYRQTMDLGHGAVEEQVVAQQKPVGAPSEAQARPVPQTTAQTAAPLAEPTREAQPPEATTPGPRPHPEPEKLAERRPEGEGIRRALTVFYEIALASTRSAAATPPPLVLPEGSESAEIRVRLARSDIYPAYRAVLTSESGETLLERPLMARAEDDPPVVTLTVPASQLVPGTYRIELWGLPSEEEAEEALGEKTFEVKSP